MNERRGSWYLITGLILGAALGLAYAWVAQPVQYTNTRPSSLRADFKDQYRSLIAAAFAANGDLVRARARLVLLQDDDVYRTLAEQAQRTLAGGSSLQEARALGMLAVALGQASAPQPTGSSPLPPTPAVSNTAELTSTLPATPTTDASASPAFTATLSVTRPAGSPTAAASRTPGASATPSLTPTPPPTRTPSPTPGAPFVLQDQDLVCDPELTVPLIQVEALDAAENGVPGVEVIVTWDGGENHFFTGLKPEMGLGYADYQMLPGVTYTLRLAEGGEPVSNLAITECQAGGETLSGSWKLIFIQP